jgi:transcription antitermination factor NusG
MNEDELKEISSIPNIMGMMGDKKPLMMRKGDVEKIIKDDLLEEHKNNKKYQP